MHADSTWCNHIPQARLSHTAMFHGDTSGQCVHLRWYVLLNDLALLQEEGHHSQVRLPNGVHWDPESCWDNLYDAIMDCRVLCYVVGESLGPGSLLYVRVHVQDAYAWTPLSRLVTLRTSEP